MISEIRQVVFDRQALETAVLAADKEDGGRLFECDSLRIDIEKEPEIGLAIEARRAASNVPERIEMSAVQVAAVMIRHCRREGIPLPKASKKSLELLGANLCLRVTLNDDAKPAGVPWSPGSPDRRIRKRP